MALSPTPSPMNLNHQRIALGSFLEEYNNRVDIISFDLDMFFVKTHQTFSFDHLYLLTKLMFQPNRKSSSSSISSSELLASSSDYPRL
ncbi:hypothetical protein V6N13_083048 [Hibiscus sabdariffa]|uniref:Uncharacterized protein n=2 Tax=Hibiscus sabdariffa TaxID=183260 RepID=A0ABR2BZ63_9ROSI